MGRISEPKSILLPVMVAEVATPTASWNPSPASCPALLQHSPCTTLRTLDSLLQELFFLRKWAGYRSSLGATPNPGWGFVLAVNHPRPPPARLLCSFIFRPLSSALTHFWLLCLYVLAGILYPKCNTIFFSKLLTSA